MIIGVSGKIGSGKDLIGKIIQYLTRKHALSIDLLRHRLTDAEWIEVLNAIPTSDWQVRKFADKLKDIVCLLTGCTREQLEDQEFKNSKLPDEWIRYGYADGFFKFYKTNWQTAYKVHPTYREVLQYIGTDLFRDKLNDNVWINALFADYKPNGVPYNSLGDLYDDLKHCSSETKLPNWIITDTRFPNELKAVKDRGGISIRVNRGKPQLYEQMNGTIENPIPTGVFKEHESETALDDAEFDYTFDNNGSIEDLIIKVEAILKLEKII